MDDVGAASASADPRPFDAEGVRKRFAGAFHPRPRIYWSDLLASSAVGWGAFALAEESGGARRDVEGLP